MHEQMLKNRGSTCYTEGIYARAIAYYQVSQLLQNYPDEQQILKNRGNTCYIEGNYAKAIAYYQLVTFS